MAKATVSPAAKRKAASKRTDEGHPVHSFRTLLTDLATLTRNTVRFGTDLQTTVLATPTTLQKHAFNLLEVSPMEVILHWRIGTYPPAYLCRSVKL